MKYTSKFNNSVYCKEYTEVRNCSMKLKTRCLFLKEEKLSE